MNIAVYGKCLSAIITSTCLAYNGNRVLWFKDSLSDIDSFEKFLNSESDLKDRFQEVKASGKLEVVNSFEESQSATLHWIHCRSSSEYNLVKLVKDIVKFKDKQQYIVLTSHHAIGIHQILEEHLSGYLESSLGGLPAIANVPLFIKEGTAIEDFEKPHTLIVGCLDEGLIKVLEDLLKPFLIKAKKSLFVSPVTAELCRTALSAMLASRLSLMNELAKLSDKIGADIDIVRKALSSDPRIGTQYLTPGCGYGGFTLIEELKNLESSFRQGSNANRLLEAIQASNRDSQELLFRKYWSFFGTEIQGKQVAILGGAFKPNVASIENSCIHTLLEAFWAQGVRTKVYDPLALPSLEAKYGNESFLELSKSIYEAAENASGLIIVTAWDEFKTVDFTRLKKVLLEPVILDGRNIYDPQLIREFGFKYIGIGKR